MRLSISSKTFDIDGHVSIDVTPNTTLLNRMYRRASSSTTLDGGVAITDRGSSDIDLPIEFTWTTDSRTDTSLLMDIVEAYSQVWVSWNNVVYLATPETLEVGGEESRLVVLPIEKASA